MNVQVKGGSFFVIPICYIGVLVVYHIVRVTKLICRALRCTLGKQSQTVSLSSTKMPVSPLKGQMGSAKASYPQRALYRYLYIYICDYIYIYVYMPTYIYTDGTVPS